MAENRPSIFGTNTCPPEKHTAEPHVGARSSCAISPLSSADSPDRDTDTTPHLSSTIWDSHPVCRSGLQELASDIKNTLASAIADMRGSRIQKYMLRDLHYRIEDLDNCGSRRRHNFRMRGLLESVLPGQLEATTLVMFNLLE